MGFKHAKTQLMECLIAGRVLHEQRNSIDVKNLLATGLVSLEEAVYIISRSHGNGYLVSPHHFDKKLDVHVLKVKLSVQTWYIKWYFIGSDSVFISFHQ